MGVLATLHGEIVGLHSTTYLNPEGITSSVGSVVPQKRGVYSYGVRSDTNGNGGNYAIGSTSSWQEGEAYQVFNESGIVGKTAVEMFVRIPIQLHNAASTDNLWIPFEPSGAANNRHIQVLITKTGALMLYSDSNILRTQLAGVFPPADGQWPVLTLWIKIDPSAGFIRCYKDFDYSTPILQWSGDTMWWATAIANVGMLHYFFGTYTGIDDVKACDITMSYSGGTGGPPSVGDTITGNVSGATAVITRVDGTATAGTLQLKYLRDSGAVEWNGVDDPFAGDASVSTVGGWSASLVNAGLDPDSRLPTDSFFAPVQLPASNGDLDELTESPVQAAGDEWKVYVYNGSGGSTPLGFGPDAEVSYGYTGVAAKQVLVDAAAFALDPAEISAISAVHVYAWARKDGSGIDHMNLNVKHGGSVGTGDSRGLGTSYDVFVQRFRTNPSTSSPWQPTELSSMQIGAEFTA